jgi:hypothetical protein
MSSYLEATTDLVRIKRDLAITGNVGIGTAAPLQKLHVVGNTRIQGDAIVTGNWEVQGTTTYIDTYTAVTSNVTIENASGNGPALRVAQTGVGAGYPVADFYDNDVSTTVPAMRIADGGNVGIGTGTPLEKLHVQGSVLATTQHLGPVADTVLAPGFSWSGDANTGIYHPGADKLGLVTAGVERVTVLDNGNVGIGTTNPLQKLHVNGRTILGGEIIGNVEVRYSGSGSGTTTLKLNNNGIDGGSPQGPILGVDGPGFSAIAFIDTYTGGVSSPTPLALRVQGTERMRILDNGFVGIGTTIPTNKLDVNGVIGTTYVSNVTLAANSALTTVLDPATNAHFDNFMNTTFGTRTYSVLASASWDFNNSASTAIFSISKFNGFTANVVKLSGCDYNGATSSTGTAIQIRNGGFNPGTPRFRILPLALIAQAL